MRRSLFLLTVVLAGLLALTGCSKKATYLKADVESVTLPRTGGADSLTLHSDGTDFSIISSPDWVTVEIRDSVLMFNAQANPEKSPRTGNIVLANGDQKLSLAVVQSAPATYLTLGATSVTIPQAGGSAELKVETDGSDVRIEGVDGVKSTYKNGTLTITGPGNNGKTRKSKGTVVCDSFSKPLTIVEKGTVCSRCNGSGRVICSRCGGQGEVFCPWDRCSTCRTTGKVTCPECHGKGK